MDTLLKETVNATVNSRYPGMAPEDRRQLEEILIRREVEKGQKDFISQLATAAGESVNGYIKKAVEERIQRENPDISLTSQTTE